MSFRKLTKRKLPSKSKSSRLFSNLFCSCYISNTILQILTSYFTQYLIETVFYTRNLQYSSSFASVLDNCPIPISHSVIFLFFYLYYKYESTTMCLSALTSFWSRENCFDCCQATQLMTKLRSITYHFQLTLDFTLHYILLSLSAYRSPLFDIGFFNSHHQVQSSAILIHDLIRLKTTLILCKCSKYMYVKYYSSHLHSKVISLLITSKCDLLLDSTTVFARYHIKQDYRLIQH